MPQTSIDYVSRTAEGGYRVAGSRVSLASIVLAYWEGRSPEAIAEDFTTISAEQVYGAIAFYLHHRAEIDQHLAEQQSAWKALAAASEAQHGPLLDRLRSCGPDFAIQPPR
jgi:uncharacterized protein (DUF433 family)